MLLLMLSFGDTLLGLLVPHSSEKSTLAWNTLKTLSDHSDNDTSFNMIRGCLILLISSTHILHDHIVRRYSIAGDEEQCVIVNCEQIPDLA